MLEVLEGGFRENRNLTMLLLRRSLPSFLVFTTIVCHALTSGGGTAFVEPSTHYAARTITPSQDLFVYETVAQTSLGYFPQTQGWSASWVRLSLGNGEAPLKIYVRLLDSNTTAASNARRPALQSVRVLPPEGAAAKLEPGEGSGGHGFSVVVTTATAGPTSPRTSSSPASP